MGEVQKYTLAEVSQRNGRADQPLWIVYKDSIYDLTKYIAEHPGGTDVMLEQAGTDATKAFDEVGHSPDAKDVMKKYKVGEVVEEEKRYDANGKKKKIVNSNPEEKSKGCLNIITCGLLG